MRTATIVRAILLLAFVFALFVWTAPWLPASADELECPPSQVPREQFDPITRRAVLVCVPQQWQPAVVNPPAANPPVNPLPPTEPSKWDQAPRTTGVFGPGGGSFDGPGGDTTVTLPGGVLPEDAQLTLVRPPLNALRPGAFALRGAARRISTLINGTGRFGCVLY